MRQLSDQVLQKRVFSQKSYDLHTANFMLGQTKEFLSKEKNTIDIGGAAGIYSTWFCKHSKHVYSFEAVPEVHKQLKKLESQFDNITTYNLALSNFNGKSVFFVDDKRLSNSSFQNLVGGIPIEVEACTIDSMDIDNVGFIKVDTEGTELDVLQGAQETIDKFNPTCMVEIYHKFNKYPPSTSFEFFFSRGYRCFYNIRPNEGLREIQSVEHGVEISAGDGMVAIHDGDFLFTKEDV